MYLNNNSWFLIKKVLQITIYKIDIIYLSIILMKEIFLEQILNFSKDKYFAIFGDENYLFERNLIEKTVIY